MNIIEILAIIGWGLAIALFIIWREAEHYFREREEDLVKRWTDEIRRHREQSDKA